MKYRNEIDGLRAFAIIPVVLFHAGYSLFSGGFIGVDIFFVISGYLITSIIINNLINQSFSQINFYSRRIKRILPLLVFVTFVTLILSFFTLNPEAFANFGKIFIGIGTFSSNYFILMQGGYFAKWVGAQPLSHTWSLSIEEQFYLFFPMIVPFLFKRGTLKFWVWVITLTSLFLAIFLSYDYMRISFFILPTRAWELGVGILIALYFDKLNNKDTILNNFIGIIGFGMIIYSVLMFNSQSSIPGISAILPVSGTALIICYSTKNTIIYKLLNIGIFKKIGLLSFGIYLWHHPIIILSKEFLGDNVYLKYRFFIILVILFFSILSYLFIEKPLRNYKIDNRKLFIYTFIILMIEILIGLYIWKMDGFIRNHKIYYEYKSQTKWEDTDNKTKDAITKFGGDQYSLVFKKNKPITDLLIGDSHANHFYYGLSNELGKRNRNLLMIGAGGCTPLLDIDLGFNFEHGSKFRCYDRMNNLYKKIIANNQIDTVYISFSQYTLFDPKMTYEDKLGDIDFNSNRLNSMLLAFKRTIDFIKSNGSNVIFIEDLPDVNDEKFKKHLLTTNSFNSITYLLKLKPMNNQYLQMLNSLNGYKGTKILRTNSALKYFPFTNSNRLLYRDNTHLTKEGSLYIIEESFKKN